MKWKFRKKESCLIQGTCVVCKVEKQRPKKRNGRVIYLAYCKACERKLWPSKPQDWRDKNKPYNKSYTKKKTCEACGFTGLHLCQLDIDHIDGDHNNNELDNLQTLCSNCHRLKTFIQLHDPEASCLK